MPRAFVFDAYGTLFDVHAAIARHRAAAGPDADRFSEVGGKQLEYTWTLTLAGRYVDFWALTERALDFAFARVPSVDKALKPRLLDAYLMLDAFPDARAVLRELKRRGEATAILSNGSPKMLAAAVEAAKIGGDLDAVLSSTRSASTSRGPRSMDSSPSISSLRPRTSSSSHRTAGTSWSGSVRLPHRLGPIEQTCRRNTGHRPSGARRPQRAHDDGSLMPPR